MWLRNYYNLLTAAILADDSLTSSTAPTEYAAPIMVRRGNGTYYACDGAACPISTVSTDTAAKVGILSIGKGNADLITYNDSSIQYQNSGKSFGISVGTGSTAATYDDYRMESIIQSGITLVSSSGTLITSTTVDSNHHVKSKRNYTINNSSGSNITITEIGIWAPFSKASTPYVCLVYREVLDSPVTLAPSESFIFSFERDAEIYNYTPYT